MNDISARLAEIGTNVNTAVDAVQNDAAASPVLVAVVREFDAKLAKAEKQVGNGDTPSAGVREAVVEAEQAADSAKVAAEADAGASPQARQAVLDAHFSICVLKAGL